MDVNWLIKPSKRAHLLVITICLVPLLLTIILEFFLRYAWLIWILTPALYYLLLKHLNLSMNKDLSLLSYQNGRWFYRDSKNAISGELTLKSFVCSFIVFLQIKNDDEQMVDLWLFADNISDEFPKWRQLHACFNLQTAK
jgi:hypothetical protein